MKLVTINKKCYTRLNAEHNNAFEAIFAPHKRDAVGASGVVHHHVPSIRPTSRVLKRLKARASTVNHIGLE